MISNIFFDTILLNFILINLLFFFSINRLNFFSFFVSFWLKPFEFFFNGFNLLSIRIRILSCDVMNKFRQFLFMSQIKHELIFKKSINNSIYNNFSYEIVSFKIFFKNLINVILFPKHFYSFFSVC